jgi:hypothetical protein
MTEIIDILKSIQGNLDKNLQDDTPLSVPTEYTVDLSIDPDYLTEKFLTPKTSFSPYWLNEFQE